MNDKKVSIIIPTYKRANLLRIAIDSALNQTYKNIEIIVVDDNDEDSSYRKENIKNLYEYIKDGLIKYIPHKHNMNGAHARNTGIKASTGDYITFLDDDDYFLPNRIQELVNILDKEEDFNCAYTSVIFSRKNKITDIKKAHMNGKRQLDMLCQKSFFGTGSNLFFRREAVISNGKFDEAFFRHQDIEYMVRFFRNNRIINLNKPLVIKCNDDRSNVSDLEKMIKTKKLLFKTFKNDIDGYSTREKNKIYFNNYYDLLKISKDNPRDYSEIKKELLSLTNNSLLVKAKLLVYTMPIKNKLIYNITKIFKKAIGFSSILHISPATRKAFLDYKRIKRTIDEN